MKALSRHLNSPYMAAILLSLVCLGLYLAGLHFTGLDAGLAYRRSEIAQGQWWRLISGNLLHTNHWHLLMNLAGLWVLLLLHHFHYRLNGLLCLLASLCLLEGLGLYLFYPGLLAYVGLSGMLHGLFAYGAIQDIRTGTKSGYLLLLGVIIKVANEQLFGAPADVSAMIGARVATESHLVGLVCGLGCGALVLVYGRCRAAAIIKKTV
ncbi:rhombosortase [Shewanella salipaludis]|uniref:Rhombosortase n=1 Tax=Shewanella salipaludis TaxID=2723052 RepID=A0A972FYG9_9GAMM|nr:rhombosortase [Shewanella salipaludis]NMH63884.1 rhombosortase [Shewanella salipaludis]